MGVVKGRCVGGVVKESQWFLNKMGKMYEKVLVLQVVRKCRSFFWKNR